MASGIATSLDVGSSQHVVVPAHLLETVSDREGWTPHAERPRDASPNRSDARANFDIRRMAIEQRDATQPVVRDRAASVSLGGVFRSRMIGQDSNANRFHVAGPRARVRKTSLPLISETSRNTLREGIENERDHLIVPAAVYKPPGESRSSYSLIPHDAGPIFQSVDFVRGRGGQLARSRTLSSDDADPLSSPRYDVDESHYPLHAQRDSPNDDDLEKGISAEGASARRPTVIDVIADSAIARTATAALQTTANTVANVVRRTSILDLYEKAKVTGQNLQRKKWVQNVFEYSVYLVLLLFVYFVLVGMPLWRGAVWWLYWVINNKFVVPGTWSITIGLALFYACAPLLILFEDEPPMPIENAEDEPRLRRGVHNTALLIPCYKSAKIIGPTLEAALKVFPPNHIYVIANGNSPTPLDNTEEVCRPYGVHHIWSPVGSKIVAQFVGCYVAEQFENILMIDDDCALPANFPIVSERMSEKVKVIGYTIKSVGPNSSRGTLCQQAQDLEYKISGLQREFAGKIGSATFPHGAISLWNTKFLIQTFHTHPGFGVSEDWFFGHVARKLGSRIKMCSAIFVETETPDALFYSSSGSRGGFGEMTAFKQRFYRWNFFFVNGTYYNLSYIFCSWKLGFWELGAKLFVWQEVYETLLYLLAPFVVPISFVVRPAFCGYLTIGTVALYYVSVTIFNEVHLRRRNERIGFVALYIYYTPFKMMLTFVNIFSCYFSLYKYARYFAKRHPKIVEDERAVGVVLRLTDVTDPGQRKTSLACSMTVTAIGRSTSGTGSRQRRTLQPTRTGPSVKDTSADEDVNVRGSSQDVPQRAFSFEIVDTNMQPRETSFSAVKEPDMMPISEQPDMLPLMEESDEEFSASILNRFSDATLADSARSIV